MSSAKKRILIVVANPDGGKVEMDSLSEPRDGNIVTGQQQHSGAETARLVIEALEE